jgi:hypothetical protein
VLTVLAAAWPRNVVGVVSLAAAAQPRHLVAGEIIGSSHEFVTSRLGRASRREERHSLSCCAAFWLRKLFIHEAVVVRSVFTFVVKSKRERPAIFIFVMRCSNSSSSIAGEHRALSSQCVCLPQ